MAKRNGVTAVAGNFLMDGIWVAFVVAVAVAAASYTSRYFPLNVSSMTTTPVLYKSG